MPTINVNGTNLFYIDQGTGTPLVFVPGLGSTHELWAPQIEAFSKTHRVIAFDPRGNGQSGKLTGPVRTILDRQTDDLAALLEHLGIQQAIICGVSYGGVFTFHFVLRHPEKCRAIVIVDSFGDTRPDNLTDKLIMLGNFNVWANYLPPVLLKPMMKPMWKRWPRAQAALMKQMDNWRAHEATLQRLAIMTAQHTPHLHQVTCPALGIVGDHTGAGVRFMQKAMGALPGARLEIIHDSFDPSNLCQLERFNRLLADFLTELEANR
ncbi:MAG TPA: alpha/beta hydrolase [Symbiobacteriaceae bacterium]|nr:alpha/beta hydrolase [Symbiobacteriaceae bacterium]